LESKLEHLTIKIETGTNHVEKCDTGKTRTIKDSAIMSGYADCKDICKLAVNILRIRNGNSPSNTGFKKEFDINEVLTFCKDNRDKLLEIDNDIKSYKKKLNKKNESIGRYPKSEDSVFGSIIWELLYEENYNYDIIKEFAFGIITVNSHPNKIIDKFRKKVIKDARLSNKNGAMTFSMFYNEFKNEFYKFAKSIVTR
jgi:hypothetical protein